MAEFENEVTDDVTDDVWTSYEDNEDETTYDNEEEEYSKAELKIFKDLWIDPNNATTDDFKKITKILAKTQKTVVKYKQWEKLSKKETQNLLSEQDLDMRDEIRDFVKENPEFKEYKDEIAKHRKNWYTLKQAVAIVENSDATIENRKKTNSMNMTDWDEWENIKTSYTKEEFWNLEWAKYEKVAKLIRSWKVKLK